MLHTEYQPVRAANTVMPAIRKIGIEASPLALTDGRFYLGIESLTDVNHVEDWALLAGSPQVDFSTVADFLPAGPAT
jgi:hypothetical protein